MNKITKLHHTNNDPDRFAGYDEPPTFEAMEAHVAEMNRENWRLLNCLNADNRDIIFVWVKDVLLAEVVNF